VPRVSAPQIGRRDEDAVARQLARETSDAGGAPARGVRGEDDRGRRLRVADEVRADDPSLRDDDGDGGGGWGVGGEGVSAAAGTA
jgi:hypothetical protein